MATKETEKKAESKKAEKAPQYVVSFHSFVDQTAKARRAVVEVDEAGAEKIAREGFWWDTGTGKKIFVPARQIDGVAEL